MNFTSGKELLTICNEKNLLISEVMIEREISQFDLTKKEIFNKMDETRTVMEESIENGKKDSKLSFTGLIGGEAKMLHEYSLKYNTISGKSVLTGVINALSVMEENSKMGKIVAAPTAGSSGILPATIISTAKRFNISNQKINEALFTASAIGYIITKNATVSGAEGGLVCDPVAGLVELPCAKRNALGVSNAMLSADMALAGIETKIPFDEVVEAMYKVGKKMHPDLKETAEGGIAATKTAREFEKKIFK